MRFTMLLKNTLSLFLVGLLAIASHVSAQQLPRPEIRYGTATLTGLIRGDIPPDLDIKAVKMVITDPLRFFTDYTIPIREDGSFRLSVPSFGITHVMITSGAYTGQVLLRPGEETHLVVSFDRTGKKHVKITGKLGLDESDLQLMPEVLGQIMEDGQKVDRATFGKLENGGDFIRYCRQYIRTAKDEASRKTALSGPAIEAVQISLTTFLLNQLNFDYYGSMKRSYYNQHHPDRDI